MWTHQWTLQSEERRSLPGTEFEIVIPFTNTESANAALEQTGKLAQGLDARVRVIAVRFVPFVLPLECPRVSIDFLKAALEDLSCSYRIGREIYLTRDPEQTWREVLSPGSLIVITPLKHLWFSPEKRLARALKRQGHNVCCPAPFLFGEAFTAWCGRPWAAPRQSFRFPR